MSLDELLGVQKETEIAPSEETHKEPTKSEEELKKEEQLTNINKAIAEANEKLRKTRQALKKPEVDDEEEIPRIDMNDPSAKAWDKHINERVNPLNTENEKEKEEIRNYALSQFLDDKPELAKDPEKMGKLMETYAVLKEGKISEKTVEGVLTYLEKAYAAEYSTDILTRQRRIARAQADAIYSDPAVSRGATSYSSERQTMPTYDSEAQAILAKWGMTPQEHAELVKKQKAEK